MDDEELRKKMVLKQLSIALAVAGSPCELCYDPQSDTVTIYFSRYCTKRVNVACDSPIAMMMDVLKQGFL